MSLSLSLTHTRTRTHTHNGILFSLEVGGHSAIYNNMDGLADIERQTEYDITYMYNLTKLNF